MSGVLVRVAAGVEEDAVLETSPALRDFAPSQ